MKRVRCNSIGSLDVGVWALRVCQRLNDTSSWYGMREWEQDGCQNSWLSLSLDRSGACSDCCGPSRLLFGSWQIKLVYFRSTRPAARIEAQIGLLGF